jgi:hypothetical protein
LLLYSSKPSLGVYQLAGHLLQANKFSGTIITAPSMGHKNLGCGYQITFKQYKYWEEQERQQCRVYNSTSLAQHSPG